MDRHLYSLQEIYSNHLYFEYGGQMLLKGVNLIDHRAHHGFDETKLVKAYLGQSEGRDQSSITPC